MGGRKNKSLRWKIGWEQAKWCSYRTLGHLICIQMTFYQRWTRPYTSKNQVLLRHTILQQLPQRPLALTKRKKTTTSDFFITPNKRPSFCSCSLTGNFHRHVVRERRCHSESTPGAWNTFNLSFGPVLGFPGRRGKKHTIIHISVAVYTNVTHYADV